MNMESINNQIKIYDDLLKDTNANLCISDSESLDSSEFKYTLKKNPDIVIEETE